MTPATAQEFSFGRHTVRVAKVRDGCWTFTIDDGEASDPFPTSTAAWAAGIRAAFILNARARLDGLA
jgi:aryl-alcohol dehydrogenase-like predicted oxidoreductase